jgi:transposase, IS30 family
MGRPPVPMEVQRRFWQRVAEGLSVVDAARAVGVSRPTGQRLFSRCGGVRPSIAVPVSGYRLGLFEREEIACLHAAGQGVRAIARVLGRNPATISRELRRNTSGGVYRASTAQQRADLRARRPKPTRLASNPRLRTEVVARLRENHSPQQVAARLRRDFPDDPELRVSHEPIYRSLYVQGRGGLRRELAQHLRTGRVLRKPRRQAGQRRERFAGMVMISERPPEVEDRAVPGHWEGDLIMGSKESGSAVGTLVERTGHGAEIVQEAMVAKMATLPDQLRRSLTWDQGAEMANHLKIAEATGLEIYFCDPHSPWQRGTNENTNGLLRQYLPKSSDLSFYGPGMLDNIADELNRRPRKTLNWATPAETLATLLSDQSGPPGVALTP